MDSTRHDFAKSSMLIGEYIHTIDDKNRISLPAKFRKEMGKSLVVLPWMDNCLAIFTEKEWTKMSYKLGDASMLQSDQRSFNRLMFGRAAEIGVDTLGRVLIPENLKTSIGLDGKAVLIGVQNRVEVWNEKKWTDYKKVIEKQADALAEKLGSVGVL